METGSKLEYIGGGSMFVPSVVNGIGKVMRKAAAPFGLEIALYDIDPAEAERMRDYAEVAQRAWGVPLATTLCRSRDEALEGADVVMVSVWLDEPHRRLDHMWERLGFRLSEEGPGAAAWASACALWSLRVAADMRRLCPSALFVTLMNPTDVIAGIVHSAGGVRAVGLCVAVDLLRGVLAYHFGVPYERIEMVHAGVNHNGWVLDLKVDGRDGYALWEERWDELEQDLNYHPGTRGVRPVWALTRHLRSSAYHNWPYQVEQTPEEAAMWPSWRGKREMHVAALDIALRTRAPIVDPPNVHPERSKVNYPWTGITVGMLIEGVATGRANTIALQLPNQGAIPNSPAEAIVEVPSLVQGRTIHPLPVGELPEWLGGTARLQAIQRSFMIAYVLSGELEILRRSLATLPMYGTVQQLNRFAEAVHAEFGRDLSIRRQGVAGL